jgi:CubicO group peptidase (beta-lactamase class C family)
MPLAYQPGTRWEYSYSIDVLGYLIEIITKKPLNEAVKELIFTPLQMSDTDYYVPADKLERLTNHYRYEDGKLQLLESSSQSPFRSLPTGLSGGGGWDTGVGGVVSTASDLCRFMQMMLNQGELEDVRVLQPETVKLMISNQISDVPDYKSVIPGYGLGIGVKPDPCDPKIMKTIFWSGGPYNTFFWVDLQTDMIYTLLVQNEPRTHINNIVKKFVPACKACAIDKP